MNNHKLFSFFIFLVIIFSGFILFYNRVLLYSHISSYGLLAIFLVVIIMDTFIQPISPDFIVFGATLKGYDLLAVSLIGGIGSCIAGVIGYIIGKRIGSERFESKFGKKHLVRGKKLFDKYDTWAIITGAVSPIPYSSICWTAGIYNMNFKHFLITSILARIPRFFLVGFIGSLL